MVAGSIKLRSWDGFVGWCRARGLNHAVAHPWTLAAYIRTLEGTMHVDKLRRHVGYIGEMYFEQYRKRPDRHPTVRRTLDSAQHRAEAAKRPVPPPLFRPDDFVSGKSPPPPPAARARKETGSKRSLRATPKLVRRKRV